MKRIINTSFIIFLLLNAWLVDAQQTGNMHVVPKSLKQNGDKLEVELVFDMSYMHMKSVEARIYTPVVVSGGKEYELPRLIIKGRNRYKLDRREEKLNRLNNSYTTRKEGDKNSLIYAVERYNRKNQIPYRATIPYKDWMQDATLNLRIESFGCCGKSMASYYLKNIFNEVVQSKQEINAKFCFLIPEPEVEKKRSEVGQAYLDFPQGKSVIDPSFSNNRSELEKINKMIVMIASNSDVKVDRIEMRGYASPESSQSYNKTLSSQRAQAMRDYFAHASSIPPGIFHTGVGGEDWEGLKSLLKNYNVSHKNEILQVIQTVSDLDTREQRIKEISGGEPYRLIYRDIYPKLRRVDCEINYTVREFSLDEGKDRIQKTPQMLSQIEMYKIARTYPEGSKDFNRILITACEHFPNNDIANLNGAAAALSEGDVELAEDYLNQVKKTDLPEYVNCKGVLYMYKKNYDAAEDFLKKAQAVGVVEATHNLGELRKIRRTSGGATSR